MHTLVIGGTGTVGSRVVRCLLDAGAAVRVQSRSQEHIQQIPGGAEGVVADPERPATLPEAFAGVDAVFLVTPLSRSETEIGLNVVEAAIEAGVRRFVYMSVQGLEEGLHVPHFRSKHAVEEAVRAGDWTWSILRPNSFFQNDLYYRNAIMQHGLYPEPFGQRGVSRVDVRDIADAAVAVLAGSEHAGQTYVVAGPDVLTGPDMAAAYTRHLDRTVRYAGDDLVAWETKMRAVMPEWLVHDLRIMYEHFQHEGLSASPEDLDRLERLLGHAPRPYDAFVAETAAAWQNAPSA